ncbi:MAG: type II toxin-antitoxin system PemK/MazF family toxin [Thermoguttaceae bacterium]
MNYADVCWVELPDRGGREQRGRRPAIVWQDTARFAHLPTILVIPLTSRRDAMRFPGTLRVEPTATNGLTTTSVALVFQLGACDVRRIGQRVGKLDDADLAAAQAIAKQLQSLS